MLATIANMLTVRWYSERIELSFTKEKCPCMGADEKNHRLAIRSML